MGSDKQGSKGGRYVGGFLQLFDWNAKSRKKLFSSRSELQEHPKQGNKSQGNSPTRTRTVDEDELGATTSVKGSGDYSCASSVTDEEGCISKPPGVVARLMGLDTLPTSNILEPYCSPFSETQSLPETPFKRGNLHFYQDHCITHPENFPEKRRVIQKSIVEPSHQGAISRPLEKFQREMLPPKSAKSIPSTHHKLLSPIKNPGFVPHRDVAHMMEAAAKIIHPGPQANVRTKISLVGSSSVPLKVRELKERVDASQRMSRFAEVSSRTLESNAAKSLKGQPLSRSWNGTVGTSSKASRGADENSACTKNKGKSVSLAVQAKVNVQRRENLNASRKNMKGMKVEEDCESQSSKSESSSHKLVHKKSTTRASSTVLRPNNQKQNCNLAKDNMPSKSLASDSHSRKMVSGDTSRRRQQNLYKDTGSSRVGSRKSSLEGRDGQKNVARKKRSIDGKLEDRTCDKADNTLISKTGMLEESNSVLDKHFSWAEDCKKKGTDVVSFTFTTPIMRSMGGSGQTKQSAEESSNIFGDNRGKKAMLCSDNHSLSSAGYNMGGDSLSVLLEQKLRELAGAVESSKQFVKPEVPSVSTRQNPSCAADNIHGRMFSSLSLTEPEVSPRRYNLQGGEGECISIKVERQFNNCQLPSPASVLDPSTSTESCNSTESTTSNVTEESKVHCSSVQSKTHHSETEMDLSDSASSSKGEVPETPSNWELDYIKETLCDLEFMFKHCASGRTKEVVNPKLFDQLETIRGNTSIRKEVIKAERKVLFDCVRECLEWRCERFAGGGRKAWSRGAAMASNREHLAEEIHKELQVWKRMGDCMVDELVDKDMSVVQGRWLEFEADEFALAVEIEDQILDSLVFEVAAEVIPFNLSKFAGFLLKV